MTLKALVLKNFRSYEKPTRIDLGPLTALIGKNDVGKSSILEALEIFFNNDTVKLDQGDRCVFSRDEDITIGCVFTDLPTSVVIDRSAATSLQNEYLLNFEGDLEILKVFGTAARSKASILAKAVHPRAAGIANLLSLKNEQLKELFDQRGVGDATIDRRRNPALRKAIWAHAQDLELGDSLVPLDDEDAKRIWESLQKELPLYQLFKSDRPSRDDDAEVQDPMKLAIAEALKSLEEQLAGIKREVELKATEVAQKTLEKLREMDAELAQSLRPVFKAEPKWDSVFKLSLMGDNDIPVNKRGSGVRRLILLNFFRAEADRKRQTGNFKGVIYAVEEPETSQHPTYQKLLAEALIELSEREGCQVLLTTHVPGFAGVFPTGAIRYIKRIETRPVVSDGSGDVYREVAAGLGVFPDHRVQLLLCVEGPHDVKCLKQMSRILNEADASLPDLAADPRVAFIPLGGSTLQQWIDEDYLREMNRPEIHLYDRGVDATPKYQRHVDAINAAKKGSYACLLGKRELENYLHPEAITEAIARTTPNFVMPAFSETDSVPELAASTIHALSAGSCPWSELDPDVRGRKISSVKRRLNEEVPSKMNYERLLEIDTNGDLTAWLREVANHLH